MHIMMYLKFSGSVHQPRVCSFLHPLKWCQLDCATIHCGWAGNVRFAARRVNFHPILDLQRSWSKVPIVHGTSGKRIGRINCCHGMCWNAPVLTKELQPRLPPDCVDDPDVLALEYGPGVTDAYGAGDLQFQPLSSHERYGARDHLYELTKVHRCLCLLRLCAAAACFLARPP